MTPKPKLNPDALDDLYEALEACADEIRALGSILVNGEPDRAYLALAARMDAALSKARGETK